MPRDGARASTAGRRPVVLVVEDDPETADLFAETLGERWPTRVAGGEAEALAKLDETVSVALVDRDLGDGTGEAVVAAVRERDVDCRVAMVTGRSFDTDAVDVAFDEYLTKPVGPEALQATVAELLNRTTYDDRVREYFALTRKRVLLEAEYDDRTLAENERYLELCSRLEEIRAAADDALDDLAERAAYEQLSRDRPDPSAPA